MEDPSPFSRIDRVIVPTSVGNATDPLSTPPTQSPFPATASPSNNLISSPITNKPVPSLPLLQPTTPPSTPSAVDTERSRAADPDVFWADHNAWLASVKDSAPARITVDEPMQQSRSLSNPNPPVTYAVATESSRVRRRYSDFEVVRAFLQSRYIGILIPSLPEKRVVGNTNDDFLQERARGLQVFMQRILENPYLVADAVVKMFLKSEPGDWEATKKSAIAGTNPSLLVVEQSPGSPAFRVGGGASNPVVFNHAEERWRAAVSMSEAPDQADAFARKTRSALVDMESSVRTLVQFAQKSVVASKLYSQSVQDCFRHLSLEKESPVRPVIVPLVETWNAISTLEPVLVEELLVESLTRELASIREMRQLLESREEFAQSADFALRALNKLEVEKESYERSGQMDRVQKTQVRIQDALKVCKTADYRAEFATKALFVAGLNSFLDSRLQSLSNILGMWAVGQVRYGELLKSVWTGSVAQLRLDFNSLLASSASAMQQVETRVDGRFVGAFRVEE